MYCMRPPRGFCVARLLQPLAGILTDGFQHPEARLLRFLVSHQALLHQGRDGIKDVEGEISGRVEHRLGVVEGAATTEDRESRKDLTLRLVQEVIAPVDSAAYGLLSAGKILGSPRQEG